MLTSQGDGEEFSTPKKQKDCSVGYTLPFPLGKPPKGVGKITSDSIVGRERGRERERKTGRGERSQDCVVNRQGFLLLTSHSRLATGGLRAPSFSRAVDRISLAGLLTAFAFPVVWPRAKINPSITSTLIIVSHRRQYQP